METVSADFGDASANVVKRKRRWKFHINLELQINLYASEAETINADGVNGCGVG
jgi:hypothetical protein